MAEQALANPVPWTTMEAAVELLLAAGGGGLLIPAHDYVGFTYVGSTNNIQTAVYKTGGAAGTTVATLTYTYVAAGAADDDDIASITKS